MIVEGIVQILLQMKQVVLSLQIGVYLLFPKKATLQKKDTSLFIHQ